MAGSARVLSSFFGCGLSRVHGDPNYQRLQGYSLLPTPSPDTPPHGRPNTLRLVKPCIVAVLRVGLRPGEKTAGAGMLPAKATGTFVLILSSLAQSQIPFSTRPASASSACVLTGFAKSLRTQAYLSKSIERSSPCHPPRPAQQCPLRLLHSEGSGLEPLLRGPASVFGDCAPPVRGFH